MGAYVPRLNKGLLFARKLVNINVSRYTAQKLAIVPECRYTCDAK